MTLNTAQIIRKGYKKTEIGVIPDDWEVKQMGKVATSIASGKSKSKFAIGTYPVFGSTGIIGWNDQYDYQGNKILIARVGANAGTVNIVDGKYGVSDNTLIVSYDKNTDINFSYYQLISIRLNQLVFGSGQPLITGGQLKSLLVPLPPTKAEQNAIAVLLSDTDTLISKLEELIAKKKAIKQGAMQELLTGKKRLPGFSGKWEVKKLGEILSYEQPTKYLVKSTEYYDNNDIAVLTANKSFILGYTDENDSVFENVPVAIFDDFTTASKYVDFPFKVKSSALKILKLKNESSDLRFVFGKMQLIQFPLGDHKRYWISEYQHLKIEVPSIKEQTAIAQILSDMDDEIEALEQKLAKYRRIKQGMMQELLTGKTRLI